MYSAKIIEDSISPTNCRLTTMEVTIPRIVLAEFNTHRTFSRNSASSRAIPVKKMIKLVKDNPFIPSYWGKNQSGMQATQEVTVIEKDIARLIWLKQLDQTIIQVEKLLDLGIHKQLANRLLEPFMWHTIIVTATDWENYFNLRCHPDAQPEIKETSVLMKEALDKSTPKEIEHGDWHLPLMPDKDEAIEWAINNNFDSNEILKKISSGRCARVSYLTHDGKRDFEKDIELHDRLIEGGHMSPLEHVATPMSLSEYTGNFKGWEQYRKFIPYESDLLGQK